MKSNLILDEQRIVHTITSLWWFYQNLKLCKTMPHDFDIIRERCPAIIREKVIDFLSIINNNGNVGTNICLTNRATCKSGSGRILKKAFSSFTSLPSKSFDESVEVNHDTNNNKSFRRSTSTICLTNNLRLNDMRKMAPREA